MDMAMHKDYVDRRLSMSSSSRRYHCPRVGISSHSQAQIVISGEVDSTVGLKKLQFAS